MNEDDVSDEELEEFYQNVKKNAEDRGYHLNPDTEFTKYLLKNILVNKKRYGYNACPCRLASGDKQEDLDIICPCDYRDPDLSEHDACYCGLYISNDILEGKKELKSIPDRRSPDRNINAESEASDITVSSLQFPVFRCNVCGYLCARDEPPEICPICKVSKERFNRFI